MTTKNFKTLHTYNTLQNADSVEWCPISPFQNYFVCGTYHLNESLPDCSGTEKREGTITMFSVTKCQLKEEYCIKTSAVLDMRWSPHALADNVVLGVANANGEICVFYLFDGCLKFITKCSLKKGNEDNLVLSLDWGKSGTEDIVCASDSKGNIALLKFCNRKLELLSEWNAHSLEAWNVCFDFFNSDVIFSGGDDGKLNVWDVRARKPNKVVVSKEHSAGITVLKSNPSKQNCLASGSYDERILIWDTRYWKEPSNTINASGGLWRLKWVPRYESHYLLAACIYGGFDIIRPYEPSFVGHYKEHESLAYGADWCYLQGGDIFDSPRQFLIATCSFYDKKLCISLWDESKDFDL